MAKATAHCHCSYCGKNFEKTATKRNWAEANDWVVWAEENIDQCYECYKQTEAEKAIADAAEVLETSYSDYKNNYSDCSTVPGSYDKKSKTIKVIVSKEHACKAELEKLVPPEYIQSHVSWFETLWNNRSRYAKATGGKVEWVAQAIEVLKKYC